MYIYEIKNVIDNKRYIGQTIKENPNDRWCAHKYELNNNKHKNLHFQNAWNKYGQDNFSFSIINTASSIEELNKLETELVQKYKTYDENFGYNIAMGGHSIGWHSIKTCNKLSKIKRPNGWPDVIGPDNKIYKIDALNTFCKEHSLSYSTMYKVISGKCRHHRNWKLIGTDLSLTQGEYKSLKTRKYESVPLLGPDKIIYQVTNLREFCRIHDLKRDRMQRLFNKTTSHHRGWTLA